jgi:MFS transporter, DHA2 family, multidrug resistance protein
MMPRRSAPFILIAATVIFGVGMAIMDQAIVNVAIPSIGGSLGATPDEAGWVATGYVLGMMLVMPLNGFLTARFGEKRYYLGAFGLFTLGSILCGFCGSIWVLVAARLVQGMGAGALQPISLSILLRNAPPERRSDVLAAFTVASTFPFALGPVIGGWILDNDTLSFPSWPMLFFFKVPLCIGGLILAALVLPEGDKSQTAAPPIQWPAFFAMAGFLACLQYVLSEGQRADWFDSQLITLLTVAAIGLFAYFVSSQMRAQRPFVNMRVFKTSSFSVGCVLFVVFGFGLYGINLVTPLFFQGPMHLTPFDSGLFLLQGTIATSLITPFVGTLTRIFDIRAFLGVALALFALGAWLMGNLTGDAGAGDVFWPRILQGLALGMIFVPLIALTLAQVPSEYLSDATGIATLVRYLGGNIGIALLQVLQVNRADAALSSLAGYANLGNTAVAHAVHAIGLPKAQALLWGIVASNASVVSYLYLFRISAVLFILTMPLLLLLPGPKRKPTIQQVMTEEEESLGVAPEPARS